jgi:hypothetical protein
MIAGKRSSSVMPAYNAERTLERTWREVVEVGKERTPPVPPAAGGRSTCVPARTGYRETGQDAP